MGLDITVCSKAELIDTQPEYQAFEDKYDWDDETLRYIHPSRQDFPERIPPIVPGGVYKIHGEIEGMACGAYSAYNRWRNALSWFALSVPASTVWGNREAYRGKPFYELIDFSDCEGVIGTDTAKKLAADFAACQDAARRHAATIEDGEYWLRKYGEWRKAFEIAADGGFVEFH
jgi:hypothetical protein